MFKKVKHLLRLHKSTIGLIALIVLLLVGTFWLWNEFNQSLKQGQLNDYVARAEAAIDEENYHLAFQLFQQAQELEPTDNYYLLRQAAVAFLNGDYKIAILLYKQVKVIKSAEIEFYTTLEELANLQFERALDELTQAESLINKERPLTIEKISSLKEKILSAQKEPNQPLRRAQIAKILLEQNAFSLTHQVLTKLIIDEPNYRDAYYLLGVTYLKQGKTEQTRESLEKALDIDPNYQPALEILEKI